MPADDPLPEEVREDVREVLRRAAAALSSWRQYLEDAARRLPPGAYALDTDEPLDLPAAWRGMIEATVQDEIAVAIESLERASRFTSDPATWYPKG